MPLLTSLQNPTVKQLRQLQQGRQRRRQGLILLEGTHLIEEAVAADYPLSLVCYTQAWRDRYPHLWQQAAQRATMQPVAAEVLKSIASTASPDGVVAIAPRRADYHPPPAQPSLAILLETLQDPGNLGTIIRTAAAAGSDGLWLSPDSVELEHPKVLRASAGQWFRLPMAIVEPRSQGRLLRAQGLQLVATSPEAETHYWELDLSRPTVFLIGNEGNGLTAELIQLATVSTRIPLALGVESLNAAIAAALLLYEARRQRFQASSR
ncbi:RNA methyltransferase [Romeria aff. gracilis LEGE 07310]|uniref:RNA methyltransferase n=2 Tax=Vasconcelosia TaxID=3366328 RepID=A0A8J7A8L7_9CYAN|nr:RNA methyltransferase [Romeria aff. gracilis LEGE 07310]